MPAFSGVSPRVGNHAPAPPRKRSTDGGRGRERGNPRRAPSRVEFAPFPGFPGVGVDISSGSLPGSVFGAVFSVSARVRAIIGRDPHGAPRPGCPSRLKFARFPGFPPLTPPTPHPPAGHPRKTPVFSVSREDPARRTSRGRSLHTRSGQPLKYCTPSRDWSFFALPVSAGQNTSHRTGASLRV